MLACLMYYYIYRAKIHFPTATLFHLQVPSIFHVFESLQLFQFSGVCLVSDNVCFFFFNIKVTFIYAAFLWYTFVRFEVYAGVGAIWKIGITVVLKINYIFNLPSYAAKSIIFSIFPPILLYFYANYSRNDREKGTFHLIAIASRL